MLNKSRLASLAVLASLASGCQQGLQVRPAATAADGPVDPETSVLAAKPDEKPAASDTQEASQTAKLPKRAEGTGTRNAIDESTELVEVRQILDELVTAGALPPDEREAWYEEYRDVALQQPQLLPRMIDALRLSRTQHKAKSSPVAADKSDSQLASGALDTATVVQAKPTSSPAPAARTMPSQTPVTTVLLPTDQAAARAQQRPPTAVSPPRAQGSQLSPAAEDPALAAASAIPLPPVDADAGAVTPRPPVQPALAVAGNKPRSAISASSNPAAQIASHATATTTTANPSSPATGGGPPLRADANWHDHLEATIEALERDLPREPKTAAQIEQHVHLRMLYLLAGQRLQAVKPIPGIDTAQQELWSEYLYGLVNYFDDEQIGELSTRAAIALQHFRRASQRLSEMGDLVVKNLKFCTKIGSFGVVTRFAEYNFQSGQEVLLYTELENYKSEATDNHRYHTRFVSHYQIFDSVGNAVPGEEFEPVEELCENPRRDYFVGYRMFIPQLNAGRYELKLTVVDEIGKKTGQGSISFTVVEE